MTEQDQLAALKEENERLKRKVQSQQELIDAISKLYDEKVRYAEEEGTKKKLEAIHAQIAVVVAEYETRMRKAIEVARDWGDDHNIVGRDELLGILERALPRR